MKSAELLYQLRELQTDWRKQDFVLSNEQQSKYNNLLQLRRERVKEFVKSGKVSKVSNTSTVEDN